LENKTTFSNSKLKTRAIYNIHQRTSLKGKIGGEIIDASTPHYS